MMGGARPGSGRKTGSIALTKINDIRNELVRVYQLYRADEITAENARIRSMLLRQLADIGQDVAMDKRMKAIEKLLELKEAA